MQKNTRTRVWILVFASFIMVGAGGYAIYRRQASASTTFAAFPSWVDSELTNRAQNYWTAGQTNYLKQILSGSTMTYGFQESCGITTQVTPNAAEIQLLGSSVKTFISYSGNSSLAQGQSSVYTDPFRIAISAEPIQNSVNGQGTLHVKIVLSNITSHPIYLDEAGLDLNIQGISPSQQSSYSVGGGTLYFVSGQTWTLSPGNYTNVVDQNINIFGVNNAAYTIAHFRTRPYNVQNGTVVRGPDGPKTVNCFPEPFSVRAMGGGSIPFSISPEPSSTVTATQISTNTPSPANTSTVSATTVSTVTSTPPVSPSVTSTQTGGVANLNYDFRKGFTAYGASTTFSASLFSAAGTYLYKFDGAQNKWILFPGSDIFDTVPGRGYYVYAQSATTISLPLAPLPTNNYSLTKGWNMLYTLGDKDLTTLNLTLNGVTKTAQEMISSGLIYDKVFIIADDTAASACNYFSLLADSTTPPDCSQNILGNDNKIPSGKNFWVYVK